MACVLQDVSSALSTGRSTGEYITGVIKGRAAAGTASTSTGGSGGTGATAAGSDGTGVPLQFAIVVCYRDCCCNCRCSCCCSCRIVVLFPSSCWLLPCGSSALVQPNCEVACFTPRSRTPLVSLVESLCCGPSSTRSTQTAAAPWTVPSWHSTCSGQQRAAPITHQSR